MIDSRGEFFGSEIEFEMHAVLARTPTAAPFEDLHTVDCLDRVDIRDHLGSHVGVGEMKPNVQCALILGGLAREADRALPLMVDKRIGLPIDVERDSKRMKAASASTSNRAAVVAVGVF